MHKIVESYIKKALKELKPGISKEEIRYEIRTYKKYLVYKVLIRAIELAVEDIE